MKRKNAWEKYNENERKEIFRFCEDYRKFISECKTEREVPTARPVNAAASTVTLPATSVERQSWGIFLPKRARFCMTDATSST